jgi:hypothetical protein
MRFGPRGDSVVLGVSTSSARVALPTLPTVNPAVALVARGGEQNVWWVKFGNSSVAATITDARRYLPGSKESPLIIPITGSPTHVAILAEGEPGDVLITSGQELMGAFAPSGTATLIDVTQTSQAVALPTLGSPIGAFTLISENGQTEALRVKLGSSGATGSDSTSMRVHPGSAGDPVILRPTNSETHLAIYCEGEPGRVLLTPGALNAGIGNLSQAQALDFLDLQSTDSPTFRGLTLNNSAGETKLTIINSNPTAGNGQNSGIEIGRVDNVAASSYIDFHTGATSVDYDARILASGGSGANGGGDLAISSAALTHNGVSLIPKLRAVSHGAFSGAAQLDFALGTLDMYEIDLGNVSASADGANLLGRFSQSGSFLSGAADYSWAYIRLASGVNDNSDSEMEFFDELTNDTTEGGLLTFRIMRPSASSFVKSMSCWGCMTRSTVASTIVNVSAGAYLRANTNAIDGLRFFADSGNISGYYAFRGYVFAP